MKAIKIKKQMPKEDRREIKREIIRMLKADKNMTRAQAVRILLG